MIDFYLSKQYKGKVYGDTMVGLAKNNLKTQ